VYGGGGHVVRQQVNELRLVLGLEKVGEDARGKSGERLVGRGKDGERALARESADEVGSLERCDEGGELRRRDSEVNDGLGSRGVRSGARHEHGVDDVHDPVGSLVVGSDHLGAIDKDGLARSPDRHVLALHGLQHLHVHEVLSVYGGGGHVVRQQVNELRLVLGLEKVGEDARGKSGERLVGRGKDGERALARESADEVGSLERCDEGGELRRRDSEVNDGLGSRGVRSGARHEHGVDDVHDPVGSLVVGSGHLGAVDKDGAAQDPGLHVLALDRLDHFHVREILGLHVARCHVVGEDVDELRLVLGLEQIGEDARGKSSERLVGRSEYGEGTLAGEGVDEVSRLERYDEGGELRCGDGEVHDSFAGRLRHEHPSTIAKGMG